MGALEGRKSGIGSSIYGKMTHGTNVLGGPMKPVASNEYVLNVAFGSFLGFTLVQLVFAFAARSQAMMADCAAMAVDAITYLFNFFAERTKHRAITEEEKLLDPEVLQSRRKLMRLYLELVPPLISVTTLLVVTIFSLKQAVEVLVENEPLDNPPDVILMLVFSGLNLLLDAVNVRCFASAEDHFVGIPSAFYQDGDHTEKTQTELTGLLDKSDDDGKLSTYARLSQGDVSPGGSEHGDDDERSSSSHPINLNMCSAWTHVFADTLRSITTLVAAGFSALFPDILSAADADSWGAIIISIIIIVSLGPLIQGLYLTAVEIRSFSSCKSSNIHNLRCHYV